MHTQNLITLSLSTLLCALSISAMSGCEEEQTYTQQRSVRRPVSTNSNSGISIAKYHQAGDGLKDAPIWIKNQDLSALRHREDTELEIYRNGNNYNPRGAWIERRERGWFLVLNEYALGYPTQFVLDGQRVELPLGESLNAQSKIQHTLEESQGRWLIPSSTFVRGKTNTWETENLFSVELLEWSVKPYQTGKGAFQVAGKATGRLLAFFKDSKNVQGWVTGRFESIPVRYMGDPSAW